MKSLSEMLAGLNPEQQAAVTHKTGPLLVFAGPGSGKTRVITTRVAWLIQEAGVNPDTILAVTFTNKAAQEMRERIVMLVGEDIASRIAIGTFHAIAARWLRRDIPILGYNSNFAIFDESDSLSVVRESAKALDLDSKDASRFYHVINRLKNDGIVGEEVTVWCNTHKYPSYYIDMYHEYESRLVLSQALDFNDLLLKVVILFKKFPHILDRYQDRYRYILVDEYQDTNKIQHELLLLLGKAHQNITVVGDDDQSIYGWRGADYENIFKLTSTFPDLRVITLGQNYRSTQTILQSASRLIENNSLRHKKALWTEGQTGAPVYLHRADNEYMEVAFIVQELLRIHKEQEVAWSQFALFYRINAQSRVFEEALRRANIPYMIVGGIGFYKRAEIKDLIGYLRLIVNPSDMAAFMRIVNVPSRGLGDKLKTTIYNYCSMQKVSVMEAAEQCIKQKLITGQRAEKLGEFLAIIKEFQKSAETDSIPDVVRDVVKKTGFRAYLEAQDSEDKRFREENVGEFINAVVAYEREHPGTSLREYLENVSLLSDIDEIDSDDEKVVLMTLHTAKGLEFDVVFLVGLEDGLFPLKRQDTKDSDLDEERRLCYVGMTRARKLLYMTWARTRTMYGVSMNRDTSGFISELPSDLVENRYQRSSSYHPGAKPLLRIRDESSSKPQPQKPAGLPADIAVHGFATGAKVIHPIFGLGEVIRCTKKNNDWRVEVAFIRVGLKVLMASISNLRKVQ